MSTKSPKLWERVERICFDKKVEGAVELGHCSETRGAIGDEKEKRKDFVGSGKEVETEVNKGADGYKWGV